MFSDREMRSIRPGLNWYKASAEWGRRAMIGAWQNTMSIVMMPSEFVSAASVLVWLEDKTTDVAG